MAKAKKAKRGRAKSEAQKIPKLSMTPGKHGENLPLMDDIEAFARERHYTISTTLVLLISSAPAFREWRRDRKAHS